MHALDVLLFDQYGNYVIKKILVELIKVRHGQRKGDPKWFNDLAAHILAKRRKLKNYTSGKCILAILKAELNKMPLVPPKFEFTVPPPALFTVPPPLPAFPDGLCFPPCRSLVDEIVNGDILNFVASPPFCC